uniref:integrin-linked kinase-associated serine/threonine phosphatase 2C isoform X2 n=1 Tax=Myxine glutinosa TaxID=7769 RepID=UPI00358E80F1
MDLFGDLPAPENKNNGVSTAKPVPTLYEEDELSSEAEANQDSSVRRNDSRIEACTAVQGTKRKAEDEPADCRPVTSTVQRDLLSLKGYVAERKGERDEMQDAHVILDDFIADFTSTPSAVSRISYYAVFDGHGGVRASSYSAQTLHLNLAKRFPKGEVANLEKEIKKCLVDTFKKTDEDFLKQASSQKPVWKDGSTATCVLVVDDVLYIANLGDSRAVLCRSNEDGKNRMAVTLSKDHTPGQYEERMRIQKSGGMVRDGRVMGTLEVSRSIGDGQYKRCGVIPTPDVRRCHLTANDRYILLACDGLFKAFSPEEAINFITPILESEEAMEKEGKSEQDVRFEAACARLASQAVRRGSADNVTVLLVCVGQSK